MNKKATKIILILAFILILSYLIVELDIFNKSNLLEFFHTLEQGEGVGIYFTIIISILMVFFVPISWFSALAGAFFGIKGYIYILTGGMIAAIISFYIAKIFREDVKKIVDKLYGRKERKVELDQVSKAIEDKGLGYIFVLRSIPFIPFSIANYVAGLSSASLKDYILGTFLGLAPSQLITTYFFAKAVDIRKNPLKALLAGAIKVSYVFIVILWQRKNKHKAKD